MLFADPLSRICAPSDGFYDVELPAKIHALLQHLPEEVQDCAGFRQQGHCGNGSNGAEVEKANEPSGARAADVIYRDVRRVIEHRGNVDNRF